MIFILFFLFFSVIYAMTTPFTTLASPASWVVNTKYLANSKQESFSERFEKEVLLGQLRVEKSTIQLDGDNFELHYKVLNQGDDVTLSHFEMELDINLDNQVMMAEGFQCWSTTREVDRYSRMAAIPGPVAWFTKFNLQGDYDFFNYTGLPGQVHSNGYTYFRDTSSGHVLFLGSLSEQVSYTYFKANLLEGKLSIYKDIQGKALAKGESAVFKFLVSQRENTSELKSIWNLYANYYDPNKQFNQPRHLTGWSSWYNTYERITEKDVVDNLNAFKKYNYPIDVFQVDDGFEAQIGDWLDINSVKFPRGMKELAADISKQGYIPGIWMAPYAVGFKSKIVKQHPEWLLKHPDGSLVVAGPNWGGFYAVDIYHPEACGYLENVFNTFIDDWGYGLLKLDFIFAAAMIPRLGKTRGEIMWDAVDLLTKWTNKRALLLGSGVTLPSVWGKFEYSRVSSDASPWWDDSILRMSSVRERVSSANAMTSTINRWAMGQSIFGSDPDVFFIRSDNNKLTKEEKFSLLNVNIVMGQLILMSDNVDRYSKEEHRLYASTFPKPKAQVQDVSTIGNDIYQVEYTCDGRSYLFISNLSPLPYTAHLPIGGEHRVHYFEHTNVLVNSRIDWLAPQSQVFLKPHETRSFMRVVSYPEDRFMGSTGHIVPGAEIESITEEKQDVIHITFRKNRALKKQKIYLSLKSNESPLPRVYVDGELAKRIEKRVWDEHVSVAKVSVYETA